MSEKDQLATETVKKYSLYSAGAGLIPMPWADWAAISALQVKMLSDLSGIYGVEFKSERVRSIIGALLGGWAGTSLGYGFGHNLLKAIPVVGPVLGGLSVPAMGGAVTWALGNVFTQHFASGGTLLDFDPEKMRAHFKSELDAKVAA